MSEYKDLLGKRFRIVEKGLDPTEVTEYLMKEIGSSDGAFKQLEQFSALQAATKTIDDAIKQAKDLAEHARTKASEEAEQEKAQAVEDGKHIAKRIINESGKGMLNYCDNASAIITDTIDEAFKRAKENIATNNNEMHKQVEKEIKTAIDQIMKDIDQIDWKSFESEDENPGPDQSDKVASTVASTPATPSDPWTNS